MYHKNLSDSINANLNSPGANEEGFFFKEGKVIVYTKNSRYELEYEGEQCYAQGGEYFLKRTPVIFNGSTWDDSMIKLKWIGAGMHLEISYNCNGEPKCLTTSAIQSWISPR